MKKLLLFPTLLLACAMYAQTVSDTCYLTFSDTVRYIDSKTNSYEGISMNQINESTSSGYAGYAQKFEAPDTIALTGACFYAVLDAVGYDTITMSLMEVDNSGAPGTVIESVISEVVTFPNGYLGSITDDDIKLCVEFSQTHLIEGDYFIALENPTDSEMFVARNADGEGQSEGLAYTYYYDGGSFDGWYHMLPFGTGWNFDVIIRPTVEYMATNIFQYDTVACVGDTFSVTNDFNMDDTLFMNKFYNPNYQNYNGINATAGYNYDGLNVSDTFHIYTAGGNYTLQNSILWTPDTWDFQNIGTTCVGSVQVTDATFNLGTDTSLCSTDSILLFIADGYDSYLWSTLDTDSAVLFNSNNLMQGNNMVIAQASIDGCTSRDTINVEFGDVMVNLGNDTTLCLNQSIVLDAGNYDSFIWNTGQLTQSITVGPFTQPSNQVIFVDVMNANCGGSDSIVVEVQDCLGMDENNFDINVSTNPSTGNIFFNGSKDLGKVNVMIYDNSGKLVFNADNYNLYNSLSLANLAKGFYVMKLVNDKINFTQSIELID